MTPNLFSPQVVCRPALPSDAADVLEFTKFIWDGHDYIKYVWNDWLADPAGIMAVAEYAGHAVALGKVTRIASGQWWLEGLRVDPKYQGLKIGSHIFAYLDDWFMEQGGALRLMTSSERVEVHHLCERFGWARLGAVKRYIAPSTPAAESPFQPVPEHQAAQALSFASANLGYCGGLIDSGWKFAAPDQETFAEKARAGQLYWWRPNAAQPRGLLTYWEDEEDEQKVLGLGFLACEITSLRELLPDVRHLASELGSSSVLWHAPVHADVEAILAGLASSRNGMAVHICLGEGLAISLQLSALSQNRPARG